MIIDVWGQHPTLRHIQDDIFAPLRRWTKGDFPHKNFLSLPRSMR